MSHPSYHHDVLTDAYFFEAYVRMANKLLKPFKGDPDVITFLSELPQAHIVRGPLSEARDLRALAVERSFVVPAFPAPTVPSYRNYDTLKNPVHLYTRKHYKSSQISPEQIKENDQLWYKQGAFDGYYEGWPSCVAIPRVIDLRNSPDVRTGTSDMFKDFNESYMVSEEHGGTFHVWHQLEIKVKNEGESGQSNQKHRDELRRGMPASPLIVTHRCAHTDPSLHNSDSMTLDNILTSLVFTRMISRMFVFLLCGCDRTRPTDNNVTLLGTDNVASTVNPYGRMVGVLLGPFKGDTAVSEFIEEAKAGFVLTETSILDSGSLRDMGDSKSWIAPALPIQSYRTATSPLHLFIRKYRTHNSMKDGRSKAERTEADDEPWSNRASIYPSQTFLALPRGVDARNLPQNRTTSRPMVRYFDEGRCTLKIDFEGRIETWRQLPIKLQEEDNGSNEIERHLNQLRRGMPASPLVTYFRLQVIAKETGHLVTSVIFRSVIVEVEENTGIRYRSWGPQDGIDHLPELRQVLSSALFGEQAKLKEPSKQPESRRSSRPHLASHTSSHTSSHISSTVRLPSIQGWTLPPLNWGQQRYTLSHRQRRIYDQSHARSAF
ncbi:hypothetical protein JCM5353_000444 [Sporobolomyces roseus]